MTNVSENMLLLRHVLHGPARARISEFILEAPTLPGVGAKEESYSQ